LQDSFFLKRNLLQLYCLVWADRSTFY